MNIKVPIKEIIKASIKHIHKIIDLTFKLFSSKSNLFTKYFISPMLLFFLDFTFHRLKAYKIRKIIRKKIKNIKILNQISFVVISPHFLIIHSQKKMIPKGRIKIRGTTLFFSLF